MKLVVVIPTYNEKENIESLVTAVFLELSKLSSDNALLVVDDNSPDDTAEIVTTLMPKYPNLFLLSGQKEGLGAAYNRALPYAFNELSADVVVTMDADFSHKPSDIPALVNGVLDGVDLAIGSRYIAGGSIPSDWAWYRKLFSSSGNTLVRFLFGTYKIHEYTTAFRAFTKSLWERLPKEKISFSDNTFLPAFIYEANRLNARILEVPVSFEDRKFGQSKIEIGNYAPNLLKYALIVFWRRLV